MDNINRHFECGDSIVKVLNVIESDEGLLYFCLNYSDVHNHFSLEIFTESQFKEWYEPNEKLDGEYLMPIVKAKHLLN